MKKFIAIFSICVIITIALIYGYFNYQYNNNSVLKHNAEYEYYYNKDIYGADIATVINMAVNNNEENNVEKDNKGKYIDDDKSSIKIDIKITDNNTIYDMETFYDGGIDKFVKNFNTIKFKGTVIKYHEVTSRIKYIYFEQITD